MKKFLARAALVLCSAWTLHTPVHAQTVPAISPSLKSMLGALPIAEIKTELQPMLAALKKTSCGAGLTGCYSTQSGPLQLYFFTSPGAQQTFLLVINKRMQLPPLLQKNVQTLLGGTYLSDPIISISTADFALDTAKMPPDLQTVIQRSYFNVGSLLFSSGVQLAARADLGGVIKTSMKLMGVDGNQLTLRAGVVMPIPTDLASGAGSGAGLAEAMQHGDTMKKAGADAAAPEAYVEFQFAPGAVLPLTTPPMNLSDATFFINNSLVFGYKGNAAFKGVNNKKMLLQFQTPITPAGAMDLLDFSFRMATPPDLTLEDAANVMAAMAVPDARLAKYGGGFIRNIESLKKPLLTAVTPLSVFQLRNPLPYAEYRFGDSSKPFPTDPNYFNVLLLGPTADSGPMMRMVGSVQVLGQTMGSIYVSAAANGFHGNVSRDLVLKLGPLGRVTIQKMQATADIDKDSQVITLKGNYYGQAVEVSLSGAQLSINVPANCVNPFEIRATATLTASTNIAQVFDGQAGANVDPASIAGCVGADLQAALHKIAGEYQSLGGYSAAQANAALDKMASDAAQAAQDAYNRTKDAARDAANQSTSSASNALKSAGNFVKGFGQKKKKKHADNSDERFAGSVFDWDYYYDRYPDVVNSGSDLPQHWQAYGFNEGRQGSLEFSVTDYLARYPDLQQAFGNNYAAALDHWLNSGMADGRQGSPNFSVRSYLNRYPDLQQAFGANNFDAAFDHWFSNGEGEGRSGRP